LTESDIKSFKEEFKNLLEKYNVTIGFSVSDCSDTYGLYDEKIVVYNDSNNIIEVQGWSIDYRDIE